MELFKKTPKVGDTFAEGGRSFTVSRVYEDGRVESMLTELYKKAEKERKAAAKSAPGGDAVLEQLRRDVERLTARVALTEAEKEAAEEDLDEKDVLLGKVQAERDAAEKALAEERAAHTAEVEALKKELAEAKKKAK